MAAGCEKEPGGEVPALRQRKAAGGAGRELRWGAHTAQPSMEGSCAAWAGGVVCIMRVFLCVKKRGHIRRTRQGA